MDSFGGFALTISINHRFTKWWFGACALISGWVWKDLVCLKGFFETYRMILTPGNWVWAQERGCPIPPQLATQPAAQSELLKDGTCVPAPPSLCGVTSQEGPSSRSRWISWTVLTRCHQGFTENLLQGTQPVPSLLVSFPLPSPSFLLWALSPAWSAQHLMKIQVRAHLPGQHASSPSPAPKRYVPPPRSINNLACRTGTKQGWWAQLPEWKHVSSSI